VTWGIVIVDRWREVIGWSLAVDNGAPFNVYTYIIDVGENIF
jgi:hypothetical protein